MATPPCKCCRDEGWVCQKHPDQPYPHPDPESPEWGVCPGPGMPCTCPIGLAMADDPERTPTPRE